MTTTMETQINTPCIAMLDNWAGRDVTIKLRSKYPDCSTEEHTMMLGKDNRLVLGPVTRRQFKYAAILEHPSKVHVKVLGADVLSL